MDEATVLWEELADLHELRQVLLQWSNELTNWLFDLRSSLPADMAAPPFEDEDPPPA
jgi:hypothetical protein